MKEHPEQAVKQAVKDMLPRNRTRKKLLTRLKIFNGPEHIHTAQIKPAAVVQTTAAARELTEPVERTS